MKASGRIRSSLLLGLGLIFACSVAISQDVIVVTHKRVSISTISKAQLREIFVGTRTRFDDGTRAVPVLLKGGPAHEVFLHHHLGDSPEEFRARWRKAVFTGQGSMPKECATEADLLEYIAATPGAIGYVSRVRDPESVKVLRVTESNKF